MITNTVNAILGTMASVIQPAPLTQTVLTIVPGNTTNFLSWSAVANATGYTVKRGTSAGVHGSTVYSGNNLVFSDTGLTNGTNYYYIVLVSFSSGSSESLEVSSSPSNSTHPQDLSGMLFGYEFFRPGLLFTDTGKSSQVTTNNQAVAYAVDISGNGNNATQSTGANQPAYKTNAIGSNSGITGSGTSKYFSTGVTQSNSKLTVIAVFKSLSGQMSLISHNVATSYLTSWVGIDGANTYPTIYTGDGTHTTTVQGMTSVDNSAACLVAQCQSGYTTIGQNGSFGASMASNAATNGTLYTGNATFLVGSSDYRGLNGGYLCALYVWNRSLTTAEIEGVLSYISGWSGISINSTAYSNVAGTTDQVQQASTNNWITNSGSNTSAEIISPQNNYRIRQTGTVARIGIKTVSLTGITGFYFKVWRKVASNSYNLIGTSENLSSSLPGAGLTSWIPLGTPITGVQEGDMIGYRIEWSGGASTYNFDSTPSGGFNSYYVFNTTPSTSGYAWESQTSTTNFMPVVIQMTQPYLDAIGDSLTPGHTDNYSFIESVDTHSLSTTIWSYWSGLAGGKSFQDMGYGGQTSTDLVNRFGAGIIDIRPSKYCHLLIGVNDIAGGVIDQTTYIANMTILLDAIVSTGAIPVVSKIWPWTSGTTLQLQTRDTWNSALATLVSGYSTAILVDASSTLGQNRVGGDGGNLWDIKTAYNLDGTHINSAGRSAYASYLYSLGVV